MNVCVDCRSNKPFERGALRCSDCQAARDAAEAREAAGRSSRTQQVLLDPRLCVTTAEIPGHALRQSLGVVTSECVFGMNVLREMAAGFTDFFGGRSGATQSVLRDARETCLGELRAAAHALGANAVVGIRLDYSEISGGGKSMLFLVASGTAAVAERVTDGTVVR
ncbi:MAG TPA: heavy metal-binding domain-containing protein [Nocardioidaceae bacterium]